LPMVTIYIFGPPGLLLYLTLRFLMRRATTLDASSAR
jgi:hypothetical protein